MADYYESNAQHLLAVLHRLDALLELCLLKFRRRHAAAVLNEFRGLYVSDDEATEALRGASTATLSMGEEEAQDEHEIRDRLAQINQAIYHKTMGSLQKGVRLALSHLANLFELSAFEVDMLMICLAPEVDVKYAKLYAYLQDDVTRKRPTVRLILDVLCQTFADEITARTLMSPQAPLFRYHLVCLGDLPADTVASSLTRPLEIDERIVQFLLGSSQVDTRLANSVDVVVPEPRTLGWDDPLHDRLQALTQDYVAQQFPDPGKLVIFLQNPCPVERRAAAEAAVHEIGLPLLVISLEALLNTSMPVALAIRLAFREGLLQAAAVYVEGCDLLLRDDERSAAARTQLFKALDELSWLTFLAGAAMVQPPADFVQQHVFIPFECPDSTFRRRQHLWQTVVDESRSILPPVELDALANTFRFRTGQIQAAMHTARNLAIARDGVDYQITVDDLYQACRSISNTKLTEHAQKLRPTFTWDDLILPADRKTQLREICQWVRHHHVVFDTWGFADKLSLGKGLNILFAGPSGTGKTMAAEILASELGLDVYKIDLSVVVSKYIGETEKNLSRIFAEAATSNAILFFDEADALFGKRSEVKDAHDRYANIEINYLLQKLEEHEGIVILATNLRKNLDEAFLRRLQFAVEFPFPDEHDRLRIWHGVFPAEAPFAPDIDLPFLAKRLKLSGGNIKNIAIHAAFLAAAHNGPICMEDVIFAAKREFQKLGKQCVRSDFEPYYDLVKEPEDVV